MSSDIIIEKLKKATEGLMFQSESDYPIEPFSMDIAGEKAITREDILRMGGYTPDTPVKSVKLEDFFRVATRGQSWHGEEEKENVRRFQELVRILKENLRDIVVFKVGDVEMDVYVVGKVESGAFSGIKTKVVET